MREAPSQRAPLKQPVPKTLYPDLERPVAPQGISTPHDELVVPMQAPGMRVAEPGEPPSANATVSVGVATTPIKAPRREKEASRSGANAAISTTGDVTPLDRVGVVVCALNGELTDITVQSMDAAHTVVIVAPADADGVLSDRLTDNVHVIELSDTEATAGRARNAGYRHLKKTTPDLKYVQFVDAGDALDPDWLAAAARHLDRRPELAAVEGQAVFTVPGNSFSRDKNKQSSNLPSGEVQTCAATGMFRAETFEEAGGFRGDIAVNETEDLCIRLRRRGGHIWRIEAPMSFPQLRRKSLTGWWVSAVRTGYAYAVGVALHGAPPENFRVSEQARAIVWGFVLPVLIVFAAASLSLAASFLSVRANPAIVGVLITGLGIAIYAIKIVVMAINGGIFKGASWVYAISLTLGAFPEFLGVVRYWATGRKKKRVRKMPA